jgi:hypothetical protein
MKIYILLLSTRSCFAIAAKTGNNSSKLVMPDSEFVVTPWRWSKIMCLHRQKYMQTHWRTRAKFTLKIHLHTCDTGSSSFSNDLRSYG